MTRAVPRLRIMMFMHILALDTTSEHGGAAIYTDRDCLVEVLNKSGSERYSVSLFELVEQALAQARLNFRDIDLYAVSNGPGSFTGIRVGLAAAQGWTKAFGKPLRCVTVLEAMVEQAQPDAVWAVPILDARRGEFFVGIYRRSDSESSGNIFQVAGEGRVVRSENLPGLLEKIAQGGQCCNLSGGKLVCLIRAHDSKARAQIESLQNAPCWVEVSGPLLGAIARLALAAHYRGETCSLDQLDAFYIRRSDAEMNWRG